MGKLKVVEGNSPAINDEVREWQGLGAENITKNDVIIPRLVILQSLSPQLSRKKPEWIEGAEAGDFCNTATGSIYKGDDGITVLPCHYATSYLEWGKSRGGFVKDHGPNQAILDKCAQNDKWQNILPNGNTVEETGQWFLLLRDGPAGSPWTRVYFPLKSTALKLSRRWLTFCRQPIGDASFNPPLFWWSWRLTVVTESNSSGDWHSFRPERSETVQELDSSLAIGRECRAFHDAVASKAVRGEAPQADPPFAHSATVESPSEQEAIPFA
jgi:hypothetical protein